VSTTPLVDRLAVWALTRPDARAFTFVDYLADLDGTAHTCTWAQLHRRATSLARRIRAEILPGDRVAIMAPSGLEYIVAIIASWYAGAVAVPLFPPDLPGHAERLTTTYTDCDPSCVITVPSRTAAVREFLAAGDHRTPVLVEDATEPPPHGWQPEPAHLDDVAYLQYSSGSTRVPAGVEITHRNLAANTAQLHEALVGDRTGITGVSWLPLFHDMGLLSAVAMPLSAGGEAVLFDPVAFLLRPDRWLRLLSGRRGAYTAAPNFAYDYCVRRLKPDDLAGLDLSGVFRWLDGAEPVRAATLERFTAMLLDAGTGFDERTLCPAYGLAEATVFVTGDGTDQAPTTWTVDRTRLAAGQAVPAGDTGGSTLVSCGAPAGQHVAVVDPERRVVVGDGRVGEIWVHGPNVGRRYWRQPERSAEVFGAALTGAPPAGLPRQPWLRTGDLGVLHEGRLYITGRLKDLVVVAGRNHYPQDIEATVAGAGPALGRVAAFAVTVDDQERAVVVGEWAGDAQPPAEIVSAVRQAVWRHHDLALHDIVLTSPGDVPRTTSGKVSRTACRSRYLSGQWGADHA
jgi:fatty acid CoA ligase FadD32